MHRLLALVLALTVVAPAQQDAGTPLALSYLEPLGRVEVNLLAPTRLAIRVAGRGNAFERELELDGLPADARVSQVEVTSFMGAGLALALVIETAGELEYRYAQTHDLHALPARSVAGTDRDLDPEWVLSGPLLRAPSDDAYRIVEIFNAGGDALEITFRRNWPKVDGRALDELLFVDTCPQFPGATVQAGRAELTRLRSESPAKGRPR